MRRSLVWFLPLVASFGVACGDSGADTGAPTDTSGTAATTDGASASHCAFAGGMGAHQRTEEVWNAYINGE